MRGATVLITCVAVLLGAASCAQRPYALPADWPISQLTLPTGSTIVVKPISLNSLLRNSPDKNWQIYFDCPGTMQTVVDHMEQCLKPLSYSEFHIDNPRIGSTRDVMRQYYSPDQLTKVEISYGLKGAGVTKKYASDFVLGVTVSAAPDPALKHAGTTSGSGVKTVLEPIQ